MQIDAIRRVGRGLGDAWSSAGLTPTRRQARTDADTVATTGCEGLHPESRFEGGPLDLSAGADRDFGVDDRTGHEIAASDTARYPPTLALRADLLQRPRSPLAAMGMLENRPVAKARRMAEARV